MSFTYEQHPAPDSSDIQTKQKEQVQRWHQSAQGIVYFY